MLRYALRSGNDVPARDPRDWTLEGSMDGARWTALDQRASERFAQRSETRTFPLAARPATRTSGLNIAATSGTGQGTQLGRLELIGLDAAGVAGGAAHLLLPERGHHRLAELDELRTGPSAIRSSAPPRPQGPTP